MKRIVLMLVLLGSGWAMAEDCKITGLETEALPGVAADKYRVYVVETRDRVYRVKPARWYSLLDIGPAACRVKETQMFIWPTGEKKEMKFNIIGMQAKDK
jgi:hypothetical protein